MKLLEALSSALLLSLLVRAKRETVSSAIDIKSEDATGIDREEGVVLTVEPADVDASRVAQQGKVGSMNTGESLSEADDKSKHVEVNHAKHTDVDASKKGKVGPKRIGAENQNLKSRFGESLFVTNTDRVENIPVEVKSADTDASHPAKQAKLGPKSGSAKTEYPKSLVGESITQSFFVTHDEIVKSNRVKLEHTIPELESAGADASQRAERGKAVPQGSAIETRLGSSTMVANDSIVGANHGQVARTNVEGSHKSKQGKAGSTKSDVVKSNDIDASHRLEPGKSGPKVEPADVESSHGAKQGKVEPKKVGAEHLNPDRSLFGTNDGIINAQHFEVDNAKPSDVDKSRRAEQGKVGPRRTGAKGESSLRILFEADEDIVKSNHVEVDNAKHGLDPADAEASQKAKQEKAETKTPVRSLVESSTGIVESNQVEVDLADEHGSHERYQKELAARLSRIWNAGPKRTGSDTMSPKARSGESLFEDDDDWIESSDVDASHIAEQEKFGPKRTSAEDSAKDAHASYTANQEGVGPKRTSAEVENLRPLISGESLFQTHNNNVKSHDVEVSSEQPELNRTLHARQVTAKNLKMDPEAMPSVHVEKLDPVTVAQIIITLPRIATFLLSCVLVCQWHMELKEDGQQPTRGCITLLCAFFCTPLACCFPVDEGGNKQ